MNTFCGLLIINLFRAVNVTHMLLENVLRTIYTGPDADTL